MATFGEVIYSVLDRIKAISDDAYYTEEHVLFLLKNMRSLLLERKYRGSRNAVVSVLSDENKQQICLSLEPTTLLPSGCGGAWLRSTAKIPNLIPGIESAACVGHDLVSYNVTFIPAERMPYVGYNKWLKNIIYASRGMDGYMYLKSPNPQFQFLERAGLTGVFADPEAAARLSHEVCENGGVCDINEQVFPLESALINTCIEMVVQELAGSAYAPQDKTNNAKDDLAGTSVTPSRLSSETPGQVAAQTEER